MKNILLNSGYEIPIIGLGVYRMHDETEAIKSILSALEMGYRHIDTAAFYENEKAVGKAVRDSGIPRSELFITTKMWHTRQENHEQKQAFQESMEKLNIDYIDLYLVHWPRDQFLQETWESMEEILQSKQTHSIGVSNHRIEDLAIIEKLGGTLPAVNQIEIQPYFQQNELVDYCQERNIQLEAWGPFTAGKTNLLEDATLLALAKKYNKTPAQIILRWNVERNIIALPKSANPMRQKQNIELFDFTLTAEDMQMVANLDCNERVGLNPTEIATQ